MADEYKARYKGAAGLARAVGKTIVRKFETDRGQRRKYGMRGQTEREYEEESVIGHAQRAGNERQGRGGR